MKRRYPTDPAREADDRKADDRNDDDLTNEEGLPPDIGPVDPDEAPLPESLDKGSQRTGSDTRSLGPSDSSDSGSDVSSGHAASADELLSDTDAAGTGERAGVGRRDADAADPAVDRVVGSEEAGLGAGLDEAEEARSAPAGRKNMRDAED